MKINDIKNLDFSLNGVNEATSGPTNLVPTGQQPQAVSITPRPTAPSTSSTPSGTVQQQTLTAPAPAPTTPTAQPVPVSSPGFNTAWQIVNQMSSLDAKELLRLMGSTP